jgi:signal transduction histidine kinase
MTSWLARLDEISNMATVSSTIALTLFIGVLDYLTGTHISLLAFYLLPIALAVWTSGPRFGIFISVFSVAVWLAGDTLGHDDAAVTPAILAWNAGIRFASYAVVVAALTNLRKLQRELEARVQQRAAALTAEIANRERLQRELLEVSEREQRRFGQDLHDGLCQHLAATALAGHVLGEKLAVQNLGEAKDAKRVVGLIEEGIALSHQLAKGLHPVDMDAAGLMQALQEFAANTGELHKVSCRFECDSPVLIHDPGTAGHMFRIAQEAVRNAIKHSGARDIVIRLDTLDEGLLLSVEDNGRGIADTRPEPRSGMGLRIMAHRSRVIGATFDLQNAASGGTIVSCLLPASEFPHEQAAQ